MLRTSLSGKSSAVLLNMHVVDAYVMDVGLVHMAIACSCSVVEDMVCCGVLCRRAIDIVQDCDKVKPGSTRNPARISLIRREQHRNNHPDSTFNSDTCQHRHPRKLMTLKRKLSS